MDNFAQNSPAFNAFAINSSPATPNIAPGEVNNLFSSAAASNAAFLAGFFSITAPRSWEIAATVPGFHLPRLWFSASAKPLNPQYQKWSLEVEHSFRSGTCRWMFSTSAITAFTNLFFDNGLNAAVPLGTPGFTNGFNGLPLTPAATNVSEPSLKPFPVASPTTTALAMTFISAAGPAGIVQVNYVYSHALDDYSNGGNPGVPFKSALPPTAPPIAPSASRRIRSIPANSIMAIPTTTSGTTSAATTSGPCRSADFSGIVAGTPLPMDGKFLARSSLAAVCPSRQ